jgi:chemotaxis protein MotA
MRLVTLGSKNPFEIDALMDEEIDTLRKEKAHVPHAIQNVADATPALGIVAAVLGVIHTMGSIKEPPEVLGHLIGGALVGTFLGVLLSVRPSFEDVEKATAEAAESVPALAKAA